MLPLNHHFHPFQPIKIKLKNLKKKKKEGKERKITMFLSNEPFSLIYVARYNKDENERLTNLLLLVASYSFLPAWSKDT